MAALYAPRDIGKCGHAMYIKWMLGKVRCLKSIFIWLVTCIFTKM